MSSTHPPTPTANRQGRSNATGIESDFVDEMRSRWRTLRGLVRRTVGYDNDALGLSANADERDRFDFPSRVGKTEAFVRWLTDALREEVLEPASPDDVREGRHWTAAFVRAAYVAGVNQSTGLLHQRGVSIENLPNDEIPTRPVMARSLERLFTRAYENLQSITQDTAPVVRDRLTEGFAKGWNPKKMAARLTGEIRDIQRTRAETLARSETINAHSEGTLDNYERAGVGVVSHGEWQATQDTRTCPFCRRLSGAELTIDEMRGTAVQWRGQIYRLQPPAHPNGRCVILPAVAGDQPTSTLGERVPGTPVSVPELAG